MSTPMGEQPGDLEDARRGDEQAMARLYDAHAPLILGLCRALTPTEADDAMQETFIRAFDKLHELDGTRGFRAWLCAIARRVCSEKRRSNGRRARHEGAAMRVMQPDTQQASSPDQRSAHREQLDRLTAAMDRLADDERLALHLHYLEADPATAAADALGLSRSGYYKLLKRARASLAELMQEAGTA